MAKTGNPFNGTYQLIQPMQLKPGRPVLTGQPVSQMTAGATE